MPRARLSLKQFCFPYTIMKEQSLWTRTCLKARGNQSISKLGRHHAHLFPRFSVWKEKTRR